MPPERENDGATWAAASRTVIARCQDQGVPAQVLPRRCRDPGDAQTSTGEFVRRLRNARRAERGGSWDQNEKWTIRACDALRQVWRVLRARGRVRACCVDHMRPYNVSTVCDGEMWRKWDNDLSTLSKSRQHTVPTGARTKTDHMNAFDTLRSTLLHQQHTFTCSKIQQWR